MALFNAGFIIRETRIAQGLSQEKLAEGICSRHTVVKIEAGTRKPEWAIFRALARRLGLEPDMFYNTIVSEQDAKVVKVYNELVRTVDRDHEAFVAMIAEMENDDAFKKGFGLRTYKQALMLKHSNPLLNSPDELQSSLECAVDIAMDMLRTNRPDFDIEKIESYYLSHEEMATLNHISNMYGRMDKREKSIELLKALIANYDKNYMSIIGSFTGRYRWGLNLSIHLYETGRYEECLKMIDEEMKNSLITNDMIFICRYVRFKAFALLKLGNMEEGEEWFKKYACLAYGMVGDTQKPSMAQISDEYKQFTGKKLTLHFETDID